MNRKWLSVATITPGIQITSFAISDAFSILQQWPVTPEYGGANRLAFLTIGGAKEKNGDIQDGRLHMDQECINSFFFIMYKASSIIFLWSKFHSNHFDFKQDAC